MELFSACFFCLGAIDYLTGNHLELGDEFKKGLTSIIELMLLMTGFMALAPWFGTHLAPGIGMVLQKIGCDPSLFATFFLSCDGGGAILAKQIAVDPQAGLYNGLIVSSLLGTAINGGIPLVLTNICEEKKTAAVNGLLIGFLIMPFAAIATGLICGFSLDMILKNTWPIAVIALVLILLFRFIPTAMTPFFSGVSIVVRTAALFGFSVSVLQQATGYVWIKELTPLDEIFPLICHIGVFLAGMMPFFALLRRILAIPLDWLAQFCKLRPIAITNLFITTANDIPVLLGLNELDGFEITLNVAYAIITAYTVGDFLAFSMQFAPTVSIPMMTGRLLSGFITLGICFLLRPLLTKKSY